MEDEISIWHLINTYDFEPEYVSIEESGADKAFFYVIKKSDDITLISSGVECRELEEVSDDFWKPYEGVKVQVSVFDSYTIIPIVAMEHIVDAIEYINEYKYLNEKGKN